MPGSIRPFFVAFLFLTLFAACRKEYGEAGVIPQGSLAPVNDPNSGIIEIQFQDEETGLPLSGLDVTLKEQWSDVNRLSELSMKTDLTGWINLKGRMDRNLLLTTVSLSDSGFYLPNGVLELTTEPLQPPTYYAIGSFMKFRPVLDEAKKKQFRVAVPRWSLIRVKFFQDSLYKPTMTKSRVFLQGAVSVLDSLGSVIEPIGDFSSPLLFETRTNGEVLVPAYAGRTYDIQWEIVELEVGTYFPEDARLWTLNQGKLKLSKARPWQDTTVELRF